MSGAMDGETMPFEQPQAAKRPQALTWVEAIEGDSRFDAGVDLLAVPASSVAEGPARRALSGAWLGHALHPLLTDLPLGCWFGAGVLDVVGGRRSRRSAQRLVAWGLVLSVPAAVSGLSDWSTVVDDRDRRVGAAHAALNGAVVLTYAWSWSLRRRRHHLRGRAVGVIGGLVAIASGYLGGHLSLRRGIGIGAPEQTLPPEEEQVAPDAEAAIIDAIQQSPSRS